MILVSACLAGINCNYKSESKPNEKIIELVRSGKAVPVCPEQLGGLPTPRSGARIVDGNGYNALESKTDLITDNETVVTENFLKGAYEVLKISKLLGIKIAILKEGSPSCGKNMVQSGSDARKTSEGIGVTAALLEKNGIKVFTEHEIDSILD